MHVKELHIFRAERRVARNNLACSLIYIERHLRLQRSYENDKCVKKQSKQSVVSIRN